MLAQQAHFCFGAAPTGQTRWVYVPLFLLEMLGSCWDTWHVERVRCDGDIGGIQNGDVNCDN
ncbi:hypothetical protein SCP_0104070 [Sparassis crispa]|uniref:Uncharacterized protein n=1 Tax=Sparassis crispa TaxID=139825 RepID=A0A401G5U1_9APHY|nr:hypothetical protein SCP_0104070 [Sparassis crispa]GBE77532.1 hypothetical protein SCP_0104070 [Sparassis crispa]